MILDQNTKLEAVLADAVSTSQPEYHVTYVDWGSNGESAAPQSSSGALNSTTDVTLLAAPVGVVLRREPVSVTIYNKDSASATVILKTDSGTERIVCRQTLGTLETLAYEKGVGWYVI